MALVLTVGTNSWATIAEADAYFEGKFGADTWSALSTLQKSQLLVTAFNWIRQQSTLAVDATETADIVKAAQYETAWFAYRWMDEYEKRRALSSSGVKSFRALDWSETLGDVKFPQFISDMLIDYATNCGGQIVSVGRNVEANGSE
jgi:hypothetical protein